MRDWRHFSASGEWSLKHEFLNSGWYDAGQLDGRLSQLLHSPHDVALHFGQESKLTVGACVRLLAFIEQFQRLGLRVDLHDLAPWGLGGCVCRDIAIRVPREMHQGSGLA